MHMASRRQAYKVNDNLRIIVVVRAATTNDTNGNPRRAWVLLNGTPSEIAPTTMSGNIITVIDEGYSGESDVRKFIETAIKPWHETLVVWGPTIATTPKEYRSLLKHNKGFTQAAVPRGRQRPLSDADEAARAARSRLKTMRMRSPARKVAPDIE